MTFRLPVLLACGLLAACNPATGDRTPESSRAANSVEAPESAERPVGGGAAADSDDPFTAMGQVRCVTRAGRSARDCTAGAARNPDGSAVVTIFWPEGRSRAVTFDVRGAATGVDTAEADGSAAQPFAARRGRDVTVVTLGPERYEIPDALVTGR